MIEGGGTALLADLGTGAFANFLAHRPLEALDAVLISHMHADHFLDVIPMRYALKYGDARPRGKLPLYLPPGGEALLRKLTGAFPREPYGHFLGEVFDVRTYDPARPLRVGEISISFAPTSHYITTFAMRFDACGRSVTYSADTAPDESVSELARGTNVFLCEATLSQSAEEELPRGHSSARQAARMASNAEVERLILTHYPATRDAAAMASEARELFAGSLQVADDGFSYEV